MMISGALGAFAAAGEDRQSAEFCALCSYPNRRTRGPTTVFRGSQLRDSQVYSNPLRSCCSHSLLQICCTRSRKMEWVTPTFEEINLSCEINSYVNAEL